MGHSLIACLAAAVAPASHAATPSSGATTSLAARPLHSTVVLRAEPDGRPLVRGGHMRKSDRHLMRTLPLSTPVRISRAMIGPR
jgi:hypothetical protein